MARDCVMMSMQYSSPSIIRATPRSCPSRMLVRCRARFLMSSITVRGYPAHRVLRPSEVQAALAWEDDTYAAHSDGPALPRRSRALACPAHDEGHRGRRPGVDGGGVRHRVLVAG